MKTQKLKLKIASDIHLEYYKSHEYVLTNFDLDANTVLVLAGDIGKPSLPSYADFLTWVANICHSVILIAGNHEHWHSKKIYSHVTPLIESIIKDKQLKNIYFLNNSSVTIKGIKFIGSTLWSDTNSSNKFIIETVMGDYHQIKHKVNNRKKAINTSFTNLWHATAVEYIKKELKDSKENKTPTIVVTHHLPTFQSLKGDSKSGCQCAYATNLEYLFEPPLIAWIHGHHHQATGLNIKINGVMVLSNPLGYQENTGYDKNLSLFLE